MLIKYRIKGKVYTLIKMLPIEDDFIKLRALVQNSKQEEFTLIKTYKYSLYDKANKLVLVTNSIREI